MGLVLILAAVSVSPIDPAALAALERRAEESRSATLVVLHEGRAVVDRTFIPKRIPIETMSATKSIVGLAVGFLVDDGKLKLDTPIHSLFPEWKEGPRSEITVRHLLEQTSGLEADRTTEKVYASPDFVRYALDAPAVTPPGTAFFYNNRATNLLAGVVARAAGKPLDAFVDERLFRPLEIREWGWTKDRAGNPHAMSGLQMRAEDLAKIGQLMLDRGVWKGKRVLSEKWIEESIAAGPFQPNVTGVEYGRLWWRYLDGAGFVVDEPLLAKWRAAKPDAAALAGMERVKGVRLSGMQPLWERMTAGMSTDDGLKLARLVIDEARKHQLPVFTPIPGTFDAFSAQGDLGQFLIVIPNRKLVVVRQRLAPTDMKDWSSQPYFMRDIIDLSRALVSKPLE
ncbi:MAG: serine hydrolase domain-containing protein [Fimbriimonas sp.]